MLDPALINQKRIALCKEGKYNVFVGRDYVTNDAAKKYGRRFMGKPRDVEKEKDKIKALIAAGVPTELSYIVPGPYDDLGYVRAVISDMIDLYSKGVRINAAELVPYPNTEIRTQLLMDNLIPQENLNDWVKYTRMLGNLVTKLNPSVENWWSNYEKIHHHMIQLAYGSSESIQYYQIKIMAMLTSLLREDGFIDADKTLMEKLHKKLTAQKQAMAEG